MRLLMLPALALYFLIGYFFSEVSKKDPDCDDFTSFLWFIFWPIILVISVLTYAITFILTVMLYIYDHLKNRLNKKKKGRL